MIQRQNAIELINALYDRNFVRIHDLLDNHPIELSYANAKKENALLLCLHFELRDIALKILDKPNCGLNQIDGLKNNILIFSAKKFYEDVSIKILNKGYKNINYVDAHGDSAFSCALRYDQFKLIKKLLTYSNLDVNHVDNHGDSCLLIAVDSLKENIALEMVNKYKVNINYVNKHGFNALILGLTKLMERLSNKLLDIKVDTSIRGNNGDTALIVALNKGFPKIAERINNETDSNNGNINEYGDIALFHAINTGNEKLCLEIFNKDNRNYDIITFNNDSCLILALTNSMYDLSELLIDIGSRDFISHINNNKDSALFVCMSKNYWALAIKILNKKYYYPNELNGEGDSILNYIINFGRDDLALKVLRDNNINVNLLFTCKDKLFKANKNLNRLRKMEVEYKNNKEIEEERINDVKNDIKGLEELKLSLEEDLKMIGNRSEADTLLMLAYINDMKKTCLELLKKMDSKVINQVNKYNDNILFLAISKDDFDFIEILISRKDINVNHMNHGNNILFLLIIKERWSLVKKMLMRKDIDLTQKSNSGLTAIKMLEFKNQKHLLKN